MKILTTILILSLLLACLVLPISAASSAAGVSSAPADTTGTPPQEASAYISEAKVAVAATNWTDALIITTRGIAWYPENADLLCLQGYTYRKIGQYQKAVDTVSRAILLDPTQVRYANRGYAYLALGNNTAALADAEEGIALNATYPANWDVKALALNGQGKNSEALAAVDQALALVPDNAHCWHVKGKILASGKDCAGATAALEKSLALDAGYVLPWPGFGSAGDDLAALNVTCSAPQSSPQATAKSPLGWLAVVGIIGAVIAIGIRK
jgi:tetratricopeptide (TPR) repeat protein